MDEEQELVPIEQQTLMFYGKPIIVVRLPDGRPGVVIRFLCENLQIDTAAQLARIRRTEVIAGDLVHARVETEGGPQKMAVLVLHGVAFWLLGIDPNRVRPEMREEVLRYQREAVDLLYTWASTPRAIAAPTKLVPAEPITKPIAPADNAPLDEWREYHRQMVAWIDWQHDIERWRGGIETWRGSMESRMEGVEAMTGLIPEILERLGPEKLTIEHQEKVQQYVEQLCEAAGKHRGTIYTRLHSAFKVPRYQELLESDWPRVENWFRVQIEQARKGKQ